MSLCDGRRDLNGRPAQCPVPTRPLSRRDDHLSPAKLVCRISSSRSLLSSLLRPTTRKIILLDLCQSDSRPTCLALLVDHAT
jgi:hypothetical protein